MAEERERPMPARAKRVYRVAFASSTAKEPYFFDIEAINDLSAALIVAHIVQTVYPRVTRYEIYDVALETRIVQVPIELALAAINDKLAQWLGQPMPLMAARIVRPKGDDFDLGRFFRGAKEPKP